jgi:hypothetical protein
MPRGGATSVRKGTSSAGRPIRTDVLVGAKSQTTARHLTVPVALALEIEVTAAERWSYQGTGCRQEQALTTSSPKATFR